LAVTDPKERAPVRARAYTNCTRCDVSCFNAQRAFLSEYPAVLFSIMRRKDRIKLLVLERTGWRVK
jgi:hypothetical protein